MADNKRPDAAPASDQTSDQKGEGSYQGTRDYNRRTEKFLDEHGNEVEGLAREAEQALEGDEGAELRRAEEAGKAPARK